MKSHKYIYYIPFGNQTIVHNALNDASFAINNEHFDSVKAIISSPDNCPSEFKVFIDKLYNNGFIVNDSSNIEDVLIKKLNQMRRSDEYSIMILPTYQCNLRCWYCVQNHEDLWITDETVNRIKKRISTMLTRPDIKRIVLSWFGGEPLLKYETVKKLTQFSSELAESLGKEFFCDITTNGTLLDHVKIEELRKAGINHYQITVDGIRNYHNSIKNLNKVSAFDTMLSNVGKIIQHTQCTLRFNYTKENMKPEELIRQLDEALPKKGRNRLDFSIYKVWQENEQAVPEKDVKLLHKLSFDIGLHPILPISGLCYADQKYFDCVFPNGKIGKCDNHSPHEAAGILQEDGSVQWHNYEDEMTPAWEFPVSECKNCQFLPVCSGPCISKREKMIREQGAIVCQFENKRENIFKYLRNAHTNKEFFKLCNQRDEQQR